ncbi:hypothetical protein [Streptomyces sp. 2A115]|uniref:hypothetical protein n=1 Tax=Streptomyces sp. 2A115 TaxID=3457439 RepID=UPI003FD568EC
MSGPAKQQTEDTSVTPVGYGYCAWHSGYSRGVRLVQLADEGSGHGSRGHFACTSCRQAYDLVPLADQPL